MKKLFTLAAAVLASFSLWAAETVNTGTYSTQTISEDFTTSTWAFAKPSSNVNIPIGAKENDIIYEASSSGKVKVGSSNLSWQGSSSVYIYVPAGAAGTISWTPSSTSESRYAQLYVNGEAAGEKRLYSKDSGTGEITTDGKKGPQSLAFTAADLTTRNDSTFLHFKDNNTELKIASIKVVLTTGDYANCTNPEAHLAFTKSTAYVGEQFSYNYGSQNGGALNTSYTLDGVPAVENTDYTFTSGNITVLKAGQFVMHRTVDAENGYCAVDVSATILINEATPVASVTVDGPTNAYVGESVTFTATAANASDYAWTVNGVDANTNAAEFTFTPTAAGEYNIVCSARNKFNATEEWIASDAKVLTVSTVSGVLVSYTVNSDANGAANLTGALATKATVKVSLTKKNPNNLTVDEVEYTGFKMDKGCYAGVTLTSGKFAEGDTVSFMVTKASGTAKLYLYDDEQGTNRLDSIDFSGQTGWATFVLNQATAGVYLYRSNPDVKPYDQNPYVAALKVIRPMAVKSSSEAFKSVSFNDEALDANNFDANHAMTVEGSYVDAPVVVFTKTVTTIYEDNSQVVKDVEVKVTAEEVAGAWQAQATINSVTYTINAAKAASFTVHYMDGTTELGTENVAVNGTVADYAQYQSKQLASFVGWYQDVDLTVEAILTAPINADTYLYAKFENKYAESINIEKAVMENSKGYDIIAQLGTLGYASNITGSLDSLSVKDDGMRNYAYLGLKVKQNGALLNFRLAAGNTVTIKFGEIKKTPNVSINGGDYADMAITGKVYTHTAGEADELISIKMMDGNAVVFQQIMIGEELQAPELFAINCAEVENGTVAAPFKMGIPGEEVELTFTPAEGYIVMNCTVNGTEIHQSAPGAAITFTMPAEDANIVTTFAAPTALENAEAAVKAEKVIRDGQVLILRDGKIFNALGAEVK